MVELDMAQKQSCCHQELYSTMRKVFIYRDREGASRIWQNNFQRFARDRGIQTVEIAFDNFFERPRSSKVILRKIRKTYQSGDLFIARFNERKETPFKSLYPQLEALFGPGNVFPDRLAVELYNNKRLQAEFFKEKGYPTPRQQWVEGAEELERFMQAHRLSFPLVRKESRGAASAGVSLIENQKTQYPCLVQEFCAHNEGDIRIMVVGDKVFGFARANREGDFRASGSGKIDYIEDLPLPCVRIAHQISRESGFVCMAYDFIKDNKGQWVVAEISYTFVSDPPRHCRYYYDAHEGFAKTQHRVGWVERLILDKMMVIG